MTNLFNQLERALQIQETKTHDTQLTWVGDNIDFAVDLIGANNMPALKEDTYLIMVGDQYVLFNRDELTEELVNEIKNELGI